MRLVLENTLDLKYEIKNKQWKKSTHQEDSNNYKNLRHLVGDHPNT